MSATTDAPATDIVAALDATDPNVPAAESGDTDDGEQTAQTEDAETGDDGDGEEKLEGEDALGDAGKKALARMKERLRNERAARREAERRLTENAPADDPERIRSEARAEATREANARIVRAEIRAAAAGKLADPADALAFVDVDQFDVGDDGSVDQTDIDDAIRELLAAKPHLAAQRGPKTPREDPSQGADGRGAATTAERFARAIDGLI